MGDEPNDGGLRDLLSRAVNAAKDLTAALRGVNAPEGDAGYVWRWAMLYVVLAYDLGRSALVLATSDETHNRTLLILRRAIFEHRTRQRYYSGNPSIARAHLEDFERLAKKFEMRIDDPGFHLVLDPAFNAANHDRQHRKFEDIVNDIYGEHGPDFYARFYSYPSALLHGDALMSMDALEMHPDGTWTVHGTSRREDTNRDVLFNYVAMFLNLLIDSVRVFGVDDADVLALASRLQAAREELGIETIELP